MIIEGADPRDVAERLGIRVLESQALPWRVSSDEEGELVICAWHPDPGVREQRLWEGIAQCLLTRRGIAWTAFHVASVALWLCLRARYR